MSPPTLSNPNGYWSLLRRHFATGLMIVVPIAVTLWAVLWLFRFVDGMLGSMIRPLLPFPIPGLGVILLLLILLGVGFFARSRAGARMILWLDMRLSRIPLASWVYGTATQITHSAVDGKKSTFERCVLVQYPKQHSWVIGFVTADAPKVARERLEIADLMAVYVPTTPNPTSGFLLFVPQSDIVELGIPTELGFKLVISAGSVSIDKVDRKSARRALAEMLSRM